MWTPSSRSEKTSSSSFSNNTSTTKGSSDDEDDGGRVSHLNVKQANEITLRQIKNAALNERREEHTVAADVATADDCELENLLKDVDDGQEEKCNKQQLLPQSSGNCRLKKRANKQETHAEPTDITAVNDAATIATTAITAAVSARLQDGAVVSVINVGSRDNVGDDTRAQQIAQLRSDKMTQYGSNSDSHAHSKLDIQKVPEDMQQQQQQNGATITPTQPTSLNATPTLANVSRTTIAPALRTTAIATTTPTATAIPTAPMAMTTTTTKTTVQGVGIPDAVAFNNTGNINNNEGNGPAHNHEQYKGPKFWRYIVRFWSTTSQKVALFVIFLLTWALAYCIFPQNVGPDTGVMRLAFLFVGADLAGVLVTHLRLPDMLGMLFFGVFYANVGLADFNGCQQLEAVLRELALINIMLLAGLGLSASAFKKLWLMILNLTVFPTVAEVTIITLIARYALSMPWLWGMLLGFVITAVSPNVVVTVMLKLKEDRLGLNGGIHTIIYATTTCNDVLAIFGFGVLLGVVFSKDSLTEQILQGPVGIGIGAVFGYLYGMMLHYLPSTKSNYLNGLRFVLTILGGCIAVMGSKAIGYPSAGALGCASLAFIASIGWKRQHCKMTTERQHANENCSVPKRLDLLWKFLKPVSFSLIGKEIVFSVLDGKVVGYGLLLVVVGSLFRLAFAYISTHGGRLTWKERAYITISGFPKATVQAALGPIALDMARSIQDIDQEKLTFASYVLIISVLAIIFTAPIGAILMLRLAPKCLQQSDPPAATDAIGDDFYDNKSNEIPDGIFINSLSKFSSTTNLSNRSKKSQVTIDVAAAGGDAVNDSYAENDVDKKQVFRSRFDLEANM